MGKGMNMAGGHKGKGQVVSVGQLGMFAMRARADSVAGVGQMSMLGDVGGVRAHIQE